VTVNLAVTVSVTVMELLGWRLEAAVIVSCEPLLHGRIGWGNCASRAECARSAVVNIDVSRSHFIMALLDRCCSTMDSMVSLIM
jgi:hypothetical protein